MQQKHLTIIFLLLLLSFLQLQPGHADTTPSIRARAAILMDARTGELLYSKNPHTVMAPASTTKIMTAILVLEKMDLDKTVYVGARAASIGGSSMHLKKREKKTIRELLYGLLLSSGNDAATALAEAVSGSEWKFAQLMNKKARELGMKKTQFKNASGLPAVNHYTTAYDLAILTRYALKNEKFCEIVSTKEKEVSGPSPGRSRKLVNHNKLLWRYEYATGVKTGYTRRAGSCLVASAKQEDKLLISVVLKSNDKYDDALNLFNFGFEKVINNNIEEPQNGEPPEAGLQNTPMASPAGTPVPETTCAK